MKPNLDRPQNISNLKQCSNETQIKMIPNLDRPQNISNLKQCSNKTQIKMIPNLDRPQNISKFHLILHIIGNGKNKETTFQISKFKTSCMHLSGLTDDRKCHAPLNVTKLRAFWAFSCDTFATQ